MKKRKNWFLVKKKTSWFSMIHIQRVDFGESFDYGLTLAKDSTSTTPYEIYCFFQKEKKSTTYSGLTLEKASTSATPYEIFLFFSKREEINDILRIQPSMGLTIQPHKEHMVWSSQNLEMCQGWYGLHKTWR
jgi:hypothetical protein